MNLKYLNDISLIFDFRSTTPQQWEDFSRYNKERAEAEMQASTRLREAIHHTLQQCANDLEAQRLATEYAYRKRLHEFKRAKDELEWQKQNVSLHQELKCFEAVELLIVYYYYRIHIMHHEAYSLKINPYLMISYVHAIQFCQNELF